MPPPLLTALRGRYHPCAGIRMRCGVLTWGAARARQQHGRRPDHPCCSCMGPGRGCAAAFGGGRALVAGAPPGLKAGRHAPRTAPQPARGVDWLVGAWRPLVPLRAGCRGTRLAFSVTAGTPPVAAQPGASVRQSACTPASPPCTPNAHGGNRVRGLYALLLLQRRLCLRLPRCSGARRNTPAAACAPLATGMEPAVAMQLVWRSGWPGWPS